MCEAQPSAEAFIVSPEGLFAAVGNNADIFAIAKEHGLATFDLRSRFVMPGIHDAHMHFLMAGLAQLNEAKLEYGVTADDIAAKLRDGQCACHYGNVYGDWLVANMYYNEGFPDSKPDRKYLDREFPDTPVMVRGGACHSMYLNTNALTAAGYNVDGEDDSHGGRYVRRDDGALTGELFDTAISRASLALPKPSLAHVKRALKHSMGAAHAAGVTSCQEASSNTLLLHALRELENEGALKFDFATHIVHNGAWISGDSKETSQALIDTAEKFESKHVDTRFVKMFIDGVPLELLHTHCGLDERGQPEMHKITTNDYREAILEYDSRGLTCKIHCTGEGGTRLALDAFEEARKRNPNGPRHEIAHCNGVHDGKIRNRLRLIKSWPRCSDEKTVDYKRFKELNVTAEMSPAMFFSHPVTKSNPLMDWNFPKMREADAFLTIGSDWGVPPDPNLLPYLTYVAEQVGGTDSKGFEAGSRETGARVVIEMLTLNGAKAVGREKDVGSIEVGKKANFIAVDRDLAKGEFEGAKVVGTWFEGELVWDNLV